MIYPLVIGPEQKERADRLVRFAKEHPYDPSKDSVPGDNPNFVLRLNDYRCVFTFTQAHGAVYRHLSISVPSPTGFPSPTAAFEIAALLGFKGWSPGDALPPSDWQVGLNHEEHCAVLAQRVEDLN